jgi:sialate O-acetylesterase
MSRSAGDVTKLSHLFQLAAWEPDMTKVVGFPDIRWHQTADYGYVPNNRMTNVFMAVAMDLPDFTSPYGKY